MFCKIVSPSSDIHKLPEVPKTFDELQRVVLKKFSHEIPDKFSLKYKDSDEDLVTVSNDDDLQTAILTNQSSNVKTLRVFIVPQTETQPTQGGKTGPRAPSPALNFPEKSETQQKPEIRVEEPYIGQLDYISSDPGKGLEENADLRTIYEQLPPMLDFKRSVSHNPQLELERNKDKNVGMKYFGKKDFIESPILGIHSPMLQEENLLNEYFNEMQMKTIMNAVEKKVKEQIEEKIKYFSDQILARFQEETANPGFFRGNPFGFKGMSSSFAPRMNMRINREGLQGEAKICKVCGGKMTNIIYNCLVCRNNFMCCENCENNVAHEHPLLKIRLSKESESYGDGNNTQVDYHGSTSGISNETFTLLNMLKRTSSYIENQSKMGTSSIGNRRTGTKNTSNANNTDDVMQPLPSLARAHTSNYIGKTEKEQGNMYNFGHNNNDDHNNNKVQHKTPINTGAEPTNLGSPGTQNSSKMITYKIALVKPPIYEVTTVRAGYPYNVSFTIKNNGDIKWPETAKLVCIEGAHKGSDIGLPALSAGTSHTVDLHLEAPWELGRFFNEWKVHYTKDGVVKSFGKEISIEIDVIDGDKQDKEKTKKEKQERTDKNHHGEKDRESKHHKEPVEKNTVLGEDQKLMKEFGCSEQTLKHARVLQDLMCTGSLKEKIEFINSCKKEWDLNQIVSAYLSSPSKLKDMMGSHATPL